MECNEDEYIHMDLDSLFREADELGILKMLQMMHLCSHKLELDIKSLVTNELDSVLLCVTTILEICTLIKNSRTNLDNIGTLIRSFEFYEKFSTKETLDKPLCDSCLNFVSEWLKKVDDGEEIALDIDALMKKVPDGSKFLLVSMAMEELQSTSMKNYRLLKDNKVLQSYNLLHIKSPALITILEHIGPKCVSGKVKEMENGVDEFVKRTKESIKFHIDKLKSHCLATLDSNNVNIILEILSTLVLMDGSDDNLEIILQRRIKLYKIAIHTLQVGSFRNLESLILHYVTNYVFISEVEAIYTKKGKEIELKEHMHADLFATILKEHLSYYSLSELGALYNKLLDYPIETSINTLDTMVKRGVAELHKCISETFKRCACDKISKYIFAISSTICKPVNISVESLYNGVNSNYREYFSFNDFIVNDQEEIGTCLDTLLGDLYAFVDISRDFRDEFSSLVHEKLSQLLSVINTHVKSLQIKEPSDDSIMLMDEETAVATLEITNYLFDGIVHKFLSSNKLVGLILSLGKFPEPLLSQVHDIYKHIARNLLEPIVKHTEITMDSLLPENDTEETFIDEEKKLYTVMIMYASFNIKCMTRVENSYKDSEFSKVIHQSALEMAFGLYTKFKSIPSQLQCDLSVLLLCYDEMFETSRVIDIEALHKRLETLCKDREVYRGLYESLKGLIS